MNRLKIFIFIFILSIPLSIHSADTLRIISYPKHLHVHVRLNSVHSQIDIRNKDIEESLQIKLNAPTHLKIGFFYSWLGLSYSLLLPTEKDKNLQFGKSGGFALEAHVMKTRLMIDLMYKSYHSYYLSNPEDFIKDWKSNNIYPQIPDLKTKVFSLSVGYVFKPDRFSPTAAYTFTKSMRHSGGSWIAGSFFSNSFVHADSSIVSKEILQWVDHKLDLKEVRFVDAGFSFGYAFLLTFLKKNFVSFSFLPGLAYQHTNQRLSVDFSHKYQDNLSLRTALHFSLGRNGDKFYWGLNSFLESGLTTNKKTELGLNSGYAEFFLGYRINTENWGFMRKVDKIMNPEFLNRIFKK